MVVFVSLVYMVVDLGIDAADAREPPPPLSRVVPI